MLKSPFINEQIYHVFNRGVEKRDIFMYDGDRVRFLHHLFAFNDTNIAQNLRSTTFKNATINEVGLRLLERNPFVEILAFVLMPNHYHLLLRQKVDGGIAKFMQKLGGGFTLFFNHKYNRVGSLFQGGFKSVLIESEAHFNYIPHYIHLNPVNLLNKRSPTSFIEQMEFLKNYKWSSFPDYVGKKNFPSVTQRDFFLDFFGGAKGYEQDIAGFLEKNGGYDNNFDPSILLDFED